MLILCKQVMMQSGIAFAETATAEASPGGAAILPWSGTTYIPGAYLLVRLNLLMINATCTKFSSNLDAATKLVKVLEDTELEGGTPNNIKRFGYALLKLETDFKITLNYLSQLLLCSGRGGELYGKYNKFRRQSSRVWTLLKRTGVRSLTVSPYDSHPLTSTSAVNNSDDTITTSNVTTFPWKSGLTDTNDTYPDNAIGLLDILDQARPTRSREPKSPIIIGLGLGFLSTYLLGNYFNSDASAIKALNDNIHTNNKNIMVTNERVDILSRNVSDAFDSIRNILDKIADSQNYADIHYTILWHLDQLMDSTTSLREAFKISEITLTLLDKGILTPELVKLESLKKIIDEGIKAFPHLHFPLAIERYKVIHITRVVTIQRIAHLRYMMVIPLMHSRKYETYSLVPHPVELGPDYMALPELANTLLKDETTYVLTQKSKIYSVSLETHLLLEVEPIFNQNRSSCEWAGYTKNFTAMLSLCNYKRISQATDMTLTETENHRLVYFANSTMVTLLCPTKNINKELIGLHKLPLVCDIKTEQVYWPAKNTLTINIDTSEDQYIDIDATYLPMISVNQSNPMHDSLKQLISEIPKKHQPMTIDYEYYDLSLEQVQTYSLFLQSLITVLTFLHSAAICFLILKWLRGNTDSKKDKFNSFKNVRDSVRKKLPRLTHVKSPKTPERIASQRIINMPNLNSAPLKAIPTYPMGQRFL